MSTALDLAKPEIKDAAERLERISTAEHAVALEQALPHLAARIRSGTVTIEDIESFLKEFPQVSADVKEYLLVKKGYLLFQESRAEEGLQSYDRALVTKEKPSTWAIKGTALLQMDRVEEALQAFRKAYELREHFGPQKPEYLKDLFRTWGTTVFFLGLDASLEQDPKEFETRVKQFLDIEEKAKNEGLEGIPGKVVFREPGVEPPGAVTTEAEDTLAVHLPETPELRAAIGELELAIKLLSIKDPFEGWHALGKEVSKRWPKGLSAVKAVREMRR